jgi:hypothetical protein
MPISLTSLVQKEKPAPVLKGLAAVGSAQHDFGSVQQNAELRHNFILVNEADVPIRITGMKSSCSCTWAETNGNFVGSILKPKEKLTFPVFFHTGSLQNTANGKIRIDFQYQKKDPKLVNDGKLLLEVTSTILPDYRLEPQELKLGNIHALESQKAKATLRVVPDQLKTLDVLSIKPSSELLTAQIVSSGEKGYEVEVEFDASSLPETQEFSGHLVVETNSKTLPKGLVRVEATYYAPANINPSSIIVTSDKSGTVVEKIRIDTSVPSQLNSVVCGSGGLIRAAFDSVQKSDKHFLTLSIDPCREAEINETITLELSFFPLVGKSVTRSCPVSVYRFHQGEKP